MLLMSLVERTEHLLKGRQVVGTPIREVSRTVKLHWRSRQLESRAGYWLKVMQKSGYL